MIMIEAADVPDREKSIKLIQDSLAQLSLKSVEKVKVYGKKQENTLPDWDQEFLLESSVIQPTTSQISLWNSLTKTATDVGITISKTADSFSQNQMWDSFTKTATETAIEQTNSLVSKVSQTIDYIDSQTNNSERVNTQETLDLAKVSEDQRIAFYGALFAIASADGNIEKDEMELIFGIMDLEGMSEEGKRQCQSFIIEPPFLDECLQKLQTADARLHYGLMVNLIDVAFVNHEIDTNELKTIKLTQKTFNITNEQVVAIGKFVKQVREIRECGLDNNQAADAMKTAAAGLSAVGVPIAAVWFSGSVIGLSAAGITSGLAALGALVGVGGMVPGIGVAILLGAGIYMGVNKFLDTGDHCKKAELQAERERKAQLVIQNLQASLNRIIERIVELEKVASDAEANKQAIQILTDKMKTLQQLVRKRQIEHKLECLEREI